MPEIRRIRIVIRGAVQGVGFRPFVYRLAREIGLTGWVSNSTEGVIIEADGAAPSLEGFLLRLHRNHPPHASIQGLEYSFLEAASFSGFEIRESTTMRGRRTLILPDIATCTDCLGEVFNPSNRRYRYPFTNCTNCGPRFTIIESLPYDRANTTMRRFRMCGLCRAEYEDPLNRRFHAQPNACPDCGPQVALWDKAGVVGAWSEEAIRCAVHALRRGLVVAVKGLGGFHLIVDAANEDAVRRLRTIKHREEKPFALMAPSIDCVRRICSVSALEERALSASEAPIVLLRRGPHELIAPSVAPNNPYLGIMLPYTPLHHILMSDIGRPVVATSGNMSDEPIAIDEHDAFLRLYGFADMFLVHDRPIRRHADDSIVRIMLGREQVLRRARGYAPMPIRTAPGAAPTLAVGGHLKNTVAMKVDGDVFVSQHVGDLETKEAFDAFTRVIDDFQSIYAVQPRSIATDLHPDYASTQYANRLSQSRSIPIERVQHHWAHVLSCMADNGVDPPALGVAWDGSGYGPDGTVWGGEFLLAHAEGFRRVAHLRTFPLPGGDAAVKRPNQTAAGVLYEIFGEESFAVEQDGLVRQMLQKEVRCPRTSSAGRLFDAVAYLIGIRDRVSFEGQAAMRLEYLAATDVDESYEFTIQSGSPLVIDWAPMIRQILDEAGAGISPPAIAAKFHNTLAKMIVEVAQLIGEKRVLLTGGCFQNRYLTERAVQRLTDAGFTPHWHQRIPPNDGGIALGQAIGAEASHRSFKQEQACVLQFQAR